MIKVYAGEVYEYKSTNYKNNYGLNTELVIKSGKPINK